MSKSDFFLKMNTIDCYEYVTLYKFSDDLSHNKFATQSHTSIGTIYEAGNAVDRNTLTCMRTQDIGTTSFKKAVWWKVNLGGMYSIYSINILFRNYVSLGIIFFNIEYGSRDTGLTQMLYEPGVMLLCARKYIKLYLKKCI